MNIKERLKDLFIVNTPEGGTRLSESMITNTVVLISSALVAVGGVGQAVAGAEITAITAGLMAVGNVVIRLRSQGGTIKAKDKKEWHQDDNDWFDQDGV